MTPEYRIISIGTLAANPLWDEKVPVRTGHATTTLIASAGAYPNLSNTGRNVAYVFEVEDMRVGHLGAIGHVPTSDQIEAMGGVDVLLVPVGGGESLDGATAAEAGTVLEPKIVIPMNFKTDADKGKLDPLDRFLKEMGAKNLEKHQKATITRSSLPEETQVLVLEYKR